MKTRVVRVVSILALVVLILVLGTLSAGAVAKSRLAKAHPAPGQLVDVGGYKMHINCTGQGSPTVILAAGMTDFSVTWAYVQPEVSKSTRVCSYDRAGMGWSEPSPYPRTANMMVDELHTLLVNANVQGPYVLVGHSLGGMLVRMYARDYPDEVLGMVLVDSAHEQQDIRRSAAVPNYKEANERAIEQGAGQFRMFALLSSTGIMALSPQSIPAMGLRDEAYAQWQAIFATTGFFDTSIAELNALVENFAEVSASPLTGFGNMPLIVLSAGRWEPDPSLSDAENQQIREVMQVLQSELAALSSQGEQVIAEQSGHFVQRDQPDLVIDAIRQVMEAVQ